MIKCMFSVTTFKMECSLLYSNMELQNDFVSSPLEQPCKNKENCKNKLHIDNYVQIDRCRNNVFAFALSAVFVHRSGMTVLSDGSNSEKNTISELIMQGKGFSHR